MFTCTRRATLVLALSLATSLTLPAAAMAGDITVFAAASMKNALDEVITNWTTETGNTAVVSYAGSSALAKQIQQGAPADVFISAAVNWMDTLQSENLIKPDTRIDLLGNSIVLIAHGTDAAPVDIASGFDLAGLLGANKLAMAMVDSVPAGVYGKAALTSLGVWETVAPNVAQADNVRAALALVATGEAPMGIVYATDAVAEPDVSVVGTFPVETHPAVIYPAAVTAETTKPEAEDFLTYLSSAAAVAAFERQGFTVLNK
ncbi:molybdate ABC transporter substrate-binding protein [Pseudogemmobacter sp. W21_MBD1_M6]|uniref:molybdate ABC transporter substrate-binding protein n=1 Tax=Pseudogemmobacter sp. W21_MBD1_M6 TaxID=3240271 RepID=UPI003F99E209